MVGVTGLGSLPGTDVAGGVRLALEATPDLPWLPEFPVRGPWAAMPGRGVALLEGIGADWVAGHWRVGGSPGVDQRRARAMLRDDLERLEENAQGLTGELKVAVPGPWTMAATMLQARGGRVVGDPGARADLAGSLAEGTRALLADIGRRLPEVTPVLQIDEPSLPAVLGGAVPTEGGYFRHRAVPDGEAAGLLAEFAALGDRTVVHSCAPGVPVGLLVGPHPSGAGFSAVSLDVTLLHSSDGDALAAALEAGREVWLGVLGAHESPSVDVAARRAISLLQPLELGPDVADRVWLTPTCGLAGAPVAEVPRVFEALRRAAPHVTEALAA